MEHILGPLSHTTVLGASFEHFLGQWGYAGIFVLSFISAMGLPVGAEVAVIYGGVLASGQIPGEEPLNIVAVIVVAVVAELLGDIAGYSIGKFGGRPLVDRFGQFPCSPTRISIGPRPGSLGVANPSLSSGVSFPCCAPSCPSPAGSARWRSANSCSTRSSVRPSGPLVRPFWAIAWEPATSTSSRRSTAGLRVGWPLRSRGDRGAGVPLPGVSQADGRAGIRACTSMTHVRR